MFKEMKKMNASSVRPMPRLPLPRGSEHDSWVIDMTRPELVRSDLPTDSTTHTPATRWVRMAMPTRGVIRAPRLLGVLADFADRMQGDLHDEFRVGRECHASVVAELILAKAMVEEGTPFAVVLVEPNGRVWFRHRLNADFWAWHPDAPKAGA